MPDQDSLYEPLNSERNEIRILQLLAGWPGTGIKCRLCTVSISDSAVPAFEALSYTWGRATQDRTIDIVDARVVHTLPVTDNLFAALEGLRCRIGRNRWLWVDAVCINQSDLSERSSQVSMMGKIYSTAERVNIWLGTPHTGAWARAMHSFSSIRRWPSLYGYRHSQRSSDGWKVWLARRVQRL